MLPSEFIPLAETGDLIGELTDNVVAAAAKCAAQWPASLKLSVNVSPLEWKDWSLPERLQGAVERGGLSMDRVVVEITESALLGNLELTQPIADDLKRAGARLALDDFGTGYSSLHHLQALPFDEIKVDASFVRSMRQQFKSRKIVASVVGLGRSLGLATVAEGVEEQAQADMLMCLGCDRAQGWLFGHPVRAEEAAQQIATWRARAGQATNREAGENAIHLETRSSERRAQVQAILTQFQAIYDDAPVGLCFLDCSLRYVSLNRHLAEMHKVPLEEHLGCTLPEVLPEMAPLLEPYLSRALAGETISNVEVQMGEPDAQRVLLVSYQPARDEANNVAGISIAVLDITEWKQGGL